MERYQAKRKLRLTLFWCRTFALSARHTYVSVAFDFCRGQWPAELCCRENTIGGAVVVAELPIVNGICLSQSCVPSHKYSTCYLLYIWYTYGMYLLSILSIFCSFVFVVLLLMWFCLRRLCTSIVSIQQREINTASGCP